MAADTRTGFWPPVTNEQRMFNKKGLERRVVAAVAKVRGGTARSEGGIWPDGWIDDTPVEVVSAFPSNDSSKWAKANAVATRQAQRSTKPVSWSVNREGSVTILDGTSPLPVDATPLNKTVGIFRAVDAKSQAYGPEAAKSAILVVHHVCAHQGLSASELERVGDHAAKIKTLFREIWIVDEYGGDAQRVPFVPLP